MRKFTVTVNGKSYDVEVEEIGGQSAAPVAAAPRMEASKPAESPKSASVGGGVPAGAETIKAPMPGTILDIKVANGDAVKEGQVLMILEAMKMENEVVSPCDGTVASVQVAKGASVESGDVLIAIA
jgi:biotin carboxyl carrier protein